MTETKTWDFDDLTIYDDLLKEYEKVKDTPKWKATPYILYGRLCIEAGRGKPFVVPRLKRQRITGSQGDTVKMQSRHNRGWRILDAYIPEKKDLGRPADFEHGWKLALRADEFFFEEVKNLINQYRGQAGKLFEQTQKIGTLEAKVAALQAELADKQDSSKRTVTK